MYKSGWVSSKSWHYTIYYLFVIEKISIILLSFRISIIYNILYYIIIHNKSFKFQQTKTNKYMTNQINIKSRVNFSYID